MTVDTELATASRLKVARAVLRMNGRGGGALAPGRLPAGTNARMVVRGAQKIVADDRAARNRKQRAKMAARSRRKNR